MTITGLLIGKNITFANFNSSCGTRDYAVGTNMKNDDGQHPMEFSNIVLDNVDMDSKVFIHRPNLNQISPAHCMDMDCDGLKKNLLTDTDGSFLGSPGTVISESEWDWGSQQRGVGDFRIPKEALANDDGTMMNLSMAYKYKGIIR